MKRRWEKEVAICTLREAIKEFFSKFEQTDGLNFDLLTFGSYRLMTDSEQSDVDIILTTFYKYLNHDNGSFFE